MTRLLRFLKRLLSNNHHHYTPLENRVHYRFKHSRFLDQAFTHRSISSAPRKNYERLEFLGDAVIDIIVSKMLMLEFPEGDEGLLTQKRSALVQKSFLASMGQLLDLLDYLEIESTVNLKEEKIAGKQQANLYEALVGALYLDGGIEPCKALILNTIWAHREEAWKTTNYKGRLIELCHSRSTGNPKFYVSDVVGPDHQKTFEVHVKINNRDFRTGIGSNKKDAEQEAAKNALEELQAQPL